MKPKSANTVRVKVRNKKIAPKVRAKTRAKGSKSTAKKRNGTGKRAPTATPKRNGKTAKKTARTGSRDNIADAAVRMVAGSAGDARSERARQARINALKEFQFKPGGPPGPGRPKGSLSLTGKLRKLLSLPVRMPGRSKADTNYTYADRMLEMAVAATQLGDFKFFKEVFDRIDGKVPDHIITESTKQMISQQAVTIATDVVEEVGKLVDRYLDDDQAEAFMNELAAHLAARFEKENGNTEGAVA